MPIGKVEVSDIGIKKQNAETREDGHPVHGFVSLMKNLRTLTLYMR